MTSTALQPAPPTPPHPPQHGEERHWPPRVLRTVVVALVLAWAVPVLAQLTRATVVLPVLVLLATASLVRGGRTLLDRIMMALALLLGAVCAGGLVFAVWPWGLEPVALTGLAFTVLVAVGAATGRRPQLPRPGTGDGLAALGAAVLTYTLAKPLVTSTPADRLGLLIPGEDLGRHATVFDAIRRTGGYTFLNWDAVTPYVYRGMITYPQGSHLLYGMLDGFLRGSAHAYGSGMGPLNHLAGFAIAGYGAFALILAWATQWVAGASLTPGRRIVLVMLVTGFCGASELLSLVPFGYPSEAAGLAEMTLLVAFVARPVRRVRQQALTLAGLLVAVGFTYYLYLPAAALALLVWLARNRGWLWRHRAFAGVTLVVAAALALLSPALGLTVGAQGYALVAQTFLDPPRDYLVALGGVVLAGLLGRRALRSRIWPAYAWCLGSAVVLAGALWTAHRTMAPDGPGSGYYASKALHLVITLLIMGTGALALYLPPPARGHALARPLWRRAADVVPAALVALAIAGAFGFVRGDTPYRPYSGTTWGRVWTNKSLHNYTDARAVLHEYQWLSGRPTMPTLVVADKPGGTYERTLFLAMLQRTSGRVAPLLYVPGPLDAPDRVEQGLLAMREPVRVVAESDDAYARVRDIQRRHPELRVELLRSTL